MRVLENTGFAKEGNCGTVYMMTLLINMVTLIFIFAEVVQRLHKVIFL